MKKKAFDSGQNEKEGWVFAPDRGPENEDRSGRRVERTLSQRVYQALKKDIITGQYQAGKR